MTTESCKNGATTLNAYPTIMHALVVWLGLWLAIVIDLSINQSNHFIVRPKVDQRAGQQSGWLVVVHTYRPISINKNIRNAGKPSGK